MKKKNQQELVDQIGMRFDEATELFSEETLESMAMSYVVGGATNNGCTQEKCNGGTDTNNGCTQNSCGTSSGTTDSSSGGTSGGTSGGNSSGVGNTGNANQGNKTYIAITCKGT